MTATYTAGVSENAAADPMVGRLLDGRYQIRSRIARGGMATVYLATDLRLERRVAVKVMHGHLADDAAFRERFIREARSAARLAHPNVVAVFDQGEDSDMAYLVMEYLPGITLRELLQEHRVLTTEQTLDILEAVLGGLTAAHRAGIVHRDLKPENVLLADDGRIKIGDFGLARAVSANTATGAALLGTIAYLSPELVTRGIADARSDIYAVGIMMYEMLTGEQPYKGEQPVQIAYQHANSVVPAPSGRNPRVPAELDELVQWATARKPEDRPADARVLLDQVLDAHGSLATSLAGTGADTGQRTQVLPGAGRRLQTGETTVFSPRPGDRGDHRHRRRPPAHRARRPGLREHRGAPDPVPQEEGPRLAAACARPRARGRRRGGRVVVRDRTRRPGGGAIRPDRSRARARRGRDRRRGSRRRAAHRGALARRSERRGLPNRPGRGDVGAQGLDRRRRRLDRAAHPRLPAVVGLPVDQAIAMLSDFDVADPVTMQFSDTAAGNSVIDVIQKSDGTSLAGVPQLAERTPIVLIVSAGLLPQVAGLTLDQAKAAIEQAGLVLGASTAKEFSDTVPVDAVIRLAPTSTPVRAGDRIDVVLSQGPELFAVPDVMNQTINEATATLEAAGFKVADPGVLDAFRDVYRAKATNPAAGEMKPKGTTVQITNFGP